MLYIIVIEDNDDDEARNNHNDVSEMENKVSSKSKCCNFTDTDMPSDIIVTIFY